jgi:hypothetical protein
MSKKESPPSNSKLTQMLLQAKKIQNSLAFGDELGLFASTFLTFASESMPISCGHDMG